MGLITNAAIIVSSTTLVGYCALRHVKTIVKEIPIPTSSILFHHFQTAKRDSPERWHSADAFEAKLPPNLPLQQDKSFLNRSFSFLRKYFLSLPLYNKFIIGNQVKLINEFLTTSCKC